MSRRTRVLFAFRELIEAHREELAAAITAEHGKVASDGTEPSSQMGPLVTGPHRDKVAAYIDTGQTEGATLAIDGRKYPVDRPDGGFWLGPSVFDHVHTDMSVYRDEIFGPVLSVLRVRSYDEALGIVNASPYGNSTAVFTNDGGPYGERLVLSLRGLQTRRGHAPRPAQSPAGAAEGALP